MATFVYLVAFFIGLIAAVLKAPHWGLFAVVLAIGAQMTVTEPKDVPKGKG